MSLKPIVVVGAAGLGRETAWLIESINEVRPTYRLLGFLDDDPTKHGCEFDGHPVLGGCRWIESCPEENLCAAIGVGRPTWKYRVVQALAGYGVDFPTLVHPGAHMSRHVELDRGAVVTAGCILTVGISLGEFAFVNLDSTVGHGARIGAYVEINPSVNISGGVTLGDGVELGTGAIVIPNCSVGEGVVIGAAACVIRDTPPNVTAVGVPARAIKELPPWTERAIPPGLLA